MALASLRIVRLPLALALVLSASCALCSQAVAAVTVPQMRNALSASGRPDTKLIDTYLKNDLFAKFVNPAGGGVMLAGLRREFGNTFKGIGKTPAHDYLNQKTLQYAKLVISDKSGRFPVASKYMAMLIIGDLMESDVPGSIKPYGDALAVLIATLSIDPAAENAYLKPAALAAIVRLAGEPGALPASEVPKISDALLKILKQTDAPPGMSGSAHTYLRRSAAAGLAALGNPGPNNEILKEFEAIVADPNARMTFRCETAQYIGQLKLTPDKKVDYKALANLIGTMTVGLMDQELDRAAEANERPSRRILMYALDSCIASMGGLRRSAEKDAEAARFISGIGSKASALQRTLDNIDETPDDQLATVVSTELEGLRSLLTPAAGAQAPLATTGAR
jgi:hypothetical protein